MIPDIYHGHYRYRGQDINHGRGRYLGRDMHLALASIGQFVDPFLVAMGDRHRDRDTHQGVAQLVECGADQDVRFAVRLQLHLPIAGPLGPPSIPRIGRDATAANGLCLLVVGCDREHRCQVGTQILCKVRQHPQAIESGLGRSRVLEAGFHTDPGLTYRLAIVDGLHVESHLVRAFRALPDDLRVRHRRSESVFPVAIGCLHETLSKGLPEPLVTLREKTMSELLLEFIEPPEVIGAVGELGVDSELDPHDLGVPESFDQHLQIAKAGIVNGKTRATVTGFPVTTRGNAKRAILHLPTQDRDPACAGVVLVTGKGNCVDFCLQTFEVGEINLRVIAICNRRKRHCARRSLARHARVGEGKRAGKKEVRRRIFPCVLVLHRNVHGDCLYVSQHSQSACADRLVLVVLCVGEEELEKGLRPVPYTAKAANPNPLKFWPSP